MPKVRIGEIEIYYDNNNSANNKLRAASYGRGLWEINLVNASLASVSTDDASNITINSAIVGGNVTDDGGNSVTERGVAWGTSMNPSITSNNKLQMGTGTGAFSNNLTALDKATTYYIRAYAITKNGTVYGENKEFTTTTSDAIVLLNEGTIKIFPNPTEGRLHISLPMTNVTLKLISLDGKVLKTIETNGEQEIEMDLESFSKGIYNLLIITQDKKEQTIKVIKK